MNLVQLSNELEYLPKDKLAQMAQDPNSMYPPYLVLAEIQRRTQMEKMYAAAQPRPKTTVAEEVVNEFTMTNPNAGISSMTVSAPTDRFSQESKDMPAPVLMQTAASGGLTGYAEGNKTKFTPTYVVPGGYYANPAYIEAMEKGELFISPNEYKYKKPEFAGGTAYEYLMNVKGEPEGVIRKGKKQTGTLPEVMLGGLAEAGNIMFNPFANEARKNITDTDQFEKLDARRTQKIKERQDIFDEIREDRQRKRKYFFDERDEAFANRRLKSEKFKQELANIRKNAVDKNLPPEYVDLQISSLYRKYDMLAPFQVKEGENIINTSQFYGEKRKPSEMLSLIQGKQKGGLTGFVQDRYYGDDGRFNVGTALLDASLLIPGAGILGGLGRGAFVLGRAGLRKLAERKALQKQGLLSKSGKKIKDFYAPRVRSRTEGGPRILDPRNTQGSAAQQLGLVDAKGRLTGEALSKGLDAGRKLNYNRVLGTAALSGVPLAMIGGASGENSATTETLPQERELTPEEKELLRLQYDAAMAETKTKRKGLDDQALDLINLGGTIMGSRNISELGQGLSGFATAKQAAKADEAQQSYYAASAAKAQAEIENMPIDQILTSIEAITKQQETALENNDTETATALGLQLQILNQRALELQGIDVQTQASYDKNLIESFG